jgi:hypothetical protein
MMVDSAKEMVNDFIGEIKDLMEKTFKKIS